jgi:hypothetical protein
MNEIRDLLWDLFLMVREIEPPSAEHTKRQQEWAARFHELEGPVAAPAAPSADDDDDEPHPHAALGKAKPKRR